MQRFSVAENSMIPSLLPGDEFVTTGSRSAVVGDIVAFPHPSRDRFWLVKRMSAGPGETVVGFGPVPADSAWVSSDNLQVGGHDSRSFGPVPLAKLQPRVERLDELAFSEAIELLTDEEPAFARVIEEHGPPPFWSRPAGFSTLVWLIMEQQVSLESGAAMYGRLHRLLGRITAEGICAVTEQGLRDVGVTRQKARYLIDLSCLVTSGELDFDAIADSSPDEARSSLLAIKGIGPWTADVYLLSALRFPDMFPLGDRALQVGTGEVLGMSSPPDREQLEMLSRPWRPIRAVAARIIWHAYLKARGRVEPLDPTLAPGEHAAPPSA